MEYILAYKPYSRDYVNPTKFIPYVVKEEKDLVAGEKIILRDCSLLLVKQLAKAFNEAYFNGLELGQELEKFGCSLK